jgi:hypothetical protein
LLFSNSLRFLSFFESISEILKLILKLSSGSIIEWWLESGAVQGVFDLFNFEFQALDFGSGFLLLILGSLFLSLAISTLYLAKLSVISSKACWASARFFF